MPPAKPALPGSAAAAKPAGAPSATAAAAAAPGPVTARIDESEAKRIAYETALTNAKEAPPQKPSLGRIVLYIAPDRKPRAAIITRVWDQGEDAPAGAVPPQERTDYVNLAVFPAEPGDNQLLRQTALTHSQDGLVFIALQIPIAREAGDIHSWMWPPRV